MNFSFFVSQSGAHHRTRVSGFIAGSVFLTQLCLGSSAVQAATPVYPPSQVITAITFDTNSKRTLAPGSDNWAMTWADDGHQYTTWGDGGGFGGSNSVGRVSVGFGRVEGGKSSYTGVNIMGGANASVSPPFEGKSLGVLSVGGSIYIFRNGSASTGSAYALTELWVTNNHFQSLSQTGVQFTDADFTASGDKGFFSPSFIQFGQDYQGARDEYIYFYAPEETAVLAAVTDGWDVQFPGKISLGRVLKTQVSDKSKYEYFAGMNGTSPTWSSDTSQRQPVFQDADNGIMRTSGSYNPVLQRYFLITQQGSRWKNQSGLPRAVIGIYEAPEPWGPWRTVLLEDPWALGIMSSSAPKTVFWNFSNKWLSADGKNFVLVYTDNDEWATIEGSFITGVGSGPADPPLTPSGVSVNVQ